MAIGGDYIELSSLRSSSPVSSRYPTTHDEDSRAVESPFVDTSTDHHQSGKAMTGAPEIRQPAQRRPKSSLPTRLLENTWTLEMLAWLLSALTLAILIIVLAHFNKHPLSKWHSSVSINTLVNVLTTISSTALIYPVASSIAQLRWLWLRKQARPLTGYESFGPGPVDVFLMVFKHPTMLLAYLGFVNVIFILLFSPITQETISLPVKQRTLNNNTGSVPTSATFLITSFLQRDISSNGEPTRDNTGSFSYRSVPALMGLAIDQGIYQLYANPSNITASCQTGNCTFGLYQTLGVCSRVDDVTSDVLKFCPRGTHSFLPGCNYTVTELQKNPPWLSGSLTTGPPINSLWIGASDPSRYAFLYHNTLNEFYVVYVSKTSVFSPASDANFTDSVTAFRGGLDLCVYQYNTTIINGITHTAQIAQLTDPTTKWENTSTTRLGVTYQVVSTTVGGTEYGMEQGTIDSFNHYLSLEVFRGSSSMGTKFINGGAGEETSPYDTADVFADLLLDKPKAEGMNGLKKRLDNLATSMTNSIRTIGDINATAPGAAKVPEVCIIVDFRWLAVPIASVILAIIFLAAVIVQTARTGTPAWRASEVATLLALNSEAIQSGIAGDNGKGIDERARGLSARLEPGVGGWVLRVGD